MFIHDFYLNDCNTIGICHVSLYLLSILCVTIGAYFIFFKIWVLLAQLIFCALNLVWIVRLTLSIQTCSCFSPPPYVTRFVLKDKVFQIGGILVQVKLIVINIYLCFPMVHTVNCRFVKCICSVHFCESN